MLRKILAYKEWGYRSLKIATSIQACEVYGIYRRSIYSKISPNRRTWTFTHNNSQQ